MLNVQITALHASSNNCFLIGSAFEIRMSLLYKKGKIQTVNPFLFPKNTAYYVQVSGIFAFEKHEK